MNLAEQLDWMKEHGSSVDLNWGEDNNLWEVSWITGGERYTGYSVEPLVALLKCVEAATKALSKEPPY